MQHFNGNVNIVSLRLFVATTGQQDEGASYKSVVHPISRTNIDTKFLHATAQGFMIACQATFQSGNTSNDRYFGLPIA